VTKRESALAVLAVFVAATVCTGGHIPADEQQAVKPGDVVVTLADAPLQVGREPLTTVLARRELVAETVNGDWVWVAVDEDGETIKGWIHAQHLTADPEAQVAGLLSRRLSRIWYSRLRMDPVPDVELDLDGFRARTKGCGLSEDTTGIFKLIDRNSSAKISHLEFMNQSARAMFRMMDKNRDDGLSFAEFVAATKTPTLEDVNKEVRRVLASPEGKPFRGRSDFPKVDEQLEWISLGPEFTAAYIELMGRFFNFDGWTMGTRITEDQADEMLRVFLKTGDVRRSRLAQHLADREDRKATTHKAEALFKWADKNRDGKLTLEELNRALEAKDKANATEEEAVPPAPPPAPLP